MKTIKFLLLICLCISMLSCGDDDNNNVPVPDPLELKQTAWKGTIFDRSGGEIYDQGPITIQFITEERGNYEFKFGNFINALLEDFKFGISDKLMQIQPVSSARPTYLSGDWIIQKHTSDSLVITKNLHLEDAVSYIIRVKKI
ncbi:hypothetical protein FACS1894179_04470 [Bacteroidia bacterium]|nr:hypothetical protein FACS1894179_04470 [Bacteroidia bacterium]